ncbi:hypothetical protein NDU88_004576 [Pleurodeles waltl]|uniref:Uncharacterized protein n=1 Tax=Pleurodeles waltl TaxID=8319 RepID=A0AAV7KZV4_PLEWA|nr:hypothetical protein NDU88_004576 [Pleurodeles waltl]
MVQFRATSAARRTPRSHLRGSLQHPATAVLNRLLTKAERPRPSSSRTRLLPIGQDSSPHQALSPHTSRPSRSSPSQPHTPAGNQRGPQGPGNPPSRGATGTQGGPGSRSRRSRNIHMGRGGPRPDTSADPAPCTPHATGADLLPGAAAALLLPRAPEARARGQKLVPGPT